MLHRREVLQEKNLPSIHPTAKSFITYDALNRLTSASGGFGPPETYTYDAIGNFLTKAGIPFYYTDPNHPSAVTSTSNGKTFTYDANGNMAKFLGTLLTSSTNGIEWHNRNL